VTLVAERDMDVDSKNQFYYQIDENLITDEMSSIRTEVCVPLKPFFPEINLLIKNEEITNYRTIIHMHIYTHPFI
jgi:hypothetical protein